MAAVDCPVLNEAASRPTELDDLQDHALGKVGALQTDAQAEADALRGQATEQGQALQQQAQAKADELKGRADALRNRATGLQTEAMSRATGLRDQAMQMQSRAQGSLTQLQTAPDKAKAQAFATAGSMRDQMTGMLVMPPALSALMQESAAEPLPEKERAREQDLEPFADDEEQEDKPMSREEWLQSQLQHRLQLAAGRALARAKAAAAALGLPTDFPPPDSDFDMHRAMQDEMGQEQQHLQDRMDQQMQDMHPEAPPYDGETAGALAGFGQCSDMLKDLIGKSLLDDNGPGEMQELVGTFGECMAAVPPIDPAQLNAMTVAGAMAKAVEQVRSKFNVDLLTDGAGARLAGILSKARALDPSALQEAAARRVAQWLPVASFAKSLNLPVNGPGALGRLGGAAKWMQGLPMPDPGKAAADMMAHMDSAAAVKRVFGADPFAKGAAAAIAPKLERVRANAEEAMSRAQGAARQAQGIAGQLSRSSVAQVAKIARSQGRDLALGKIRHAATPVLAKAMPVLSTLQSVRQATGKKVTLPGKGSWRRR
jgi:hypothetical protein